MSGKTDEKPKETHLEDFVYMQAPDTAPGAKDGEVVKVPNNTTQIQRKMFAGYKQVFSAKGERD
jgi:hypothetical protein